MNPIAFNLFGLPIAWYGIIISFAIIVGYFVGQLQSKLYDMDFDKITDVFIVALPISVICARLYYVIFEWSYYKNDLMEILNIRGGGLAIHGGILGAILSGYLMARYKKIDFLKLLDVVGPPFIIAQAIGRWGNFFNSEAHGGEVSKEFISHFPSFIQKGMYIDGAYYHPTFLYESSWNLMVFIFLMIISRKVKLYKGSIFFLYLMLYSIGRFFIEGLRTDSLMIGPFRMAQLISLIFIFAALIFLIVLNKRKTTKYI
ncbi:prolipoprotein diacylglyceryl transferase [Clostridium homopropionicum DSM 5847]|uniref:Phosphatidylglycerol--prolipoprotein diacylglyceryl transferase n=1 Tax=Clostridium homopropionicum DSM 5847 TaxID=1121318 RepID=A0A0L6ZEB4_9CLOT|nr:prolipoprotein diacylglyceryl transferase [Clostridium homopropionicum]KOA21310.1 prolipoprotein diacylglyceryl transferase [Clostridium homopropionicum DSM 5847]SFG30732.1 Prolipoprotein diacylglyceryl transferase [Clostridium homopropionicum]